MADGWWRWDPELEVWRAARDGPPSNGNDAYWHHGQRPTWNGPIVTFT